MKKLTLFFALFISATIAWSWWQVLSPPDEDEIEIKEIIIPPGPGPKSGTVSPIKAWYNHELCMIRIETDGQQGSMVVSVENGVGTLVVQQVVNGNQPIIKLLLPSLSAGYYNLSMQSNTRQFVGKFEIY